MSENWDNLSVARWQQMRLSHQHWEGKLRHARQVPPAGLLLGNNLADSLPVFLTPELLATHLHIMGPTGVGKSFLIEAIIKSLILLGYGVVLIDPHGDLYHRLLAFCVWLSLQKPELQLHRRVVPFDVAETRHIIGFNPVARNARVMTYQVVALMESIRKCWGQGSFQETPRLARWLFNVAYALVSANVTFVQAQHLVSPAASPLRSAITARIANPRIRAEWEWLEAMKLDRREERIESTLNRIKPFVEHEVIRPMLGQYTKTLDFPSILAERKILLVNLARQNVISEDNQHLLGTLLVNELITAAFARKPTERKECFVFIDEFSRFVTKDACEILDGGRKFGLHLTLAHQHLGQLKEKDAEVYYSTLTNARTKIVFGGLNDEDVELISKELFTGEFDPDEVKDEIFHRGFEPVESSRIIYGDSSSDAAGDSYGEVNHSSLVDSRVVIPGSEPWSPSTLASTNHAVGNSRGRSRSHQASHSSGHIETRVPFHEFHEYRELTSRTFRSLEEQLYRKKAELKRQPNQHAAVMIPGQPVQLIKVATLRELPVTVKQSEEFRQQCIETAGCYKSPEEAEAELVGLENKLLLEAKSSITVTSEPLPAVAEEKPKSAKVRSSIWNRAQPPGGNHE